MIEVDDGLDGDFVVAYNGRGNPSQTEYTIDSLIAQRQYKSESSPTSKACDFELSEEITLYTVTIPGQPGTPRMTSSSATSINLEWEPAYEDRGSPIQNYVLEMDEVEGLGVENIEDWQTVFTGSALSFAVTNGVGSVTLVPKLKYRFRVLAISEYQKESPYSKIASFYAAALPE